MTFSASKTPEIKLADLAFLVTLQDNNNVNAIIKNSHQQDHGSVNLDRHPIPRDA